MLSNILSFILRFALVLLVSFFVVLLIPVQGENAETGRLAIAVVIWFFGFLWCSMDFHKPIGALSETLVGDADEKYRLEKSAKEKRLIEDEILRVLKLKEAGVLSDDDAEQRITEFKARYNKI